MSDYTNPLGMLLFAMIVPKCGMENCPKPLPEPVKRVQKAPPSTLKIPELKPTAVSDEPLVETTSPASPQPEQSLEDIKEEVIQRKIGELKTKYEEEQKHIGDVMYVALRACQSGAQAAVKAQGLEINAAIQVIQTAMQECEQVPSQFASFDPEPDYRAQAIKELYGNEESKEEKKSEDSNED